MAELERLAARGEAEQAALGYQHTLREIMQQPDTWAATCQTALQHHGDLEWALNGAEFVVLTGSGSSQFAGECVRLGLQGQSTAAVQVTGGGALVTHGRRELPAGRPGLMLSLARSGDSPESTAAVESLLQSCPGMRHLVITCNALGKLATQYRGDSRVRVVVLDERTNDRSLVMTSSFTNMVLAAQALTSLAAPRRYEDNCQKLAELCRGLLRSGGDEIARVARLPFRRVMYLGSGARFGAARESALKMLEMTGGRIGTMCETYLGLRHGPMSYLDSETLVVCFLSSEPALRAYECDLIDELNQKRLCLAKLFFGERLPAHLAHQGDGMVECPGLAEVPDEAAPVLDVVAGQLLAFFRCLHEGLRPDSPSEAGVINRVVGSFTLHTVHA